MVMWTYNQSTNKILNLITAQVEILVCVRELREVERHLLVSERAPSKVGLGELTWRFCCDASFFVDALVSQLLYSCAAGHVSKVQLELG